MNNFIEQLLDQNRRAFVPKKLRVLVEEAATLLAQVEELRRERDGLRSIVSKMTNALPSGAYCSPEASLEFMEHLPDEVLLCTSKLVDRATKGEAGMAEAVKVLEPFAAEAAQWADTVSPYYAPPQPEPGRKKALPGSEAKFSVSDLRAARAFVEKHKESGNG